MKSSDETTHAAYLEMVAKERAALYSPFVESITQYLMRYPGGELTMSPEKFYRFRDTLPVWLRVCRGSRQDIHLVWVGTIVRPLNNEKEYCRARIKYAADIEYCNECTEIKPCRCDRDWDAAYGEA